MENEEVTVHGIEEEAKHQFAMLMLGTGAGFLAGKLAGSLYKIAVEAYRANKDETSETE